MSAKIFVVLVSLTLLSECYGLQCYECQNIKTGKCDPVKEVRCPGKCLWAQAKMGSDVEVVKTCSPSDEYCTVMEQIIKIKFPQIEAFNCRICDTDLCNSGSIISSAIVPIFLAAFYSFW